MIEQLTQSVDEHIENAQVLRRYQDSQLARIIPNHTARIIIAPNRAIVSGDAVHAYINHGRWLVDCPNCNSSDLVRKDEPKFYCIECENNYVSNSYVRVIFPKDVAKIEEALLLRNRQFNRNWRPTETLKDLLAENKAYITAESSVL